MTINEHLLIKIAEECNEVAQRCQKALCYGESEIQDGQALDNIQRIKYEYNDLLAMIEIAKERGMDITRHQGAIDVKKQKYYIELGKSICLGIVERDEPNSDELESSFNEKFETEQGDVYYLISKTDKDRIIVLKGMLKELPATLTDENMDKMSEIGEEIRKIGRKYEML